VRLPVRPLLLAALLLFLVFGETPDRTRFWKELFNLGHAPLSGLLALIIRGWIANREGAAWRGAVARASVLAFIATVAIGSAVEALQVLQSDRNASWIDMGRNTAGAASFLLLREAAVRWLGGASGAARRTAWAAGLAGLALLAGSGVGFARTVSLYVERHRSMPTLFALDGSWWERELIEEEGSRLTPSAGLARLDLAPGKYPGLDFEEPYPDWRGYRTLALTIVSDLDAPLTMTVRIHDARHNRRLEDRFNRRLVVQPGENTFRIPIDEIRRAPRGREMDLARIRGIMIFSGRLDHPTHVYLGPLRLEQ